MMGVRMYDIETSVEDTPEKSGQLIYPNPASYFITIEVKPSEGYKVQIFNTLGIEVGQSSLIVNSSDTNGQAGMLNLLKIDISNLPTGVYFIKIGDRVEKFVKM
jgi:hypothetical protein